MRRTILITGCSSGIGRESALAMRDRGWSVFATARAERDLERLRVEGVVPIRLDYTQPDSIEACARRVLTETEGELFALFNNGGYAQPGAVEDLNTDVLRRQFETNLFGWHDLTRRVLSVMRARGRGRIVHCSSLLGFIGLKYRGAYVASKFALEGLTNCMRLELRGTDIFVSLIEPGPIKTGISENALRAFHENIDVENSVFRGEYKRCMDDHIRDGRSRRIPPPDTVVRRLIHAVESETPKARYYATRSAFVLATLNRLLPTFIFDAIAQKIS